jgi:hypothetical protein
LEKPGLGKSNGKMSWADKICSFPGKISLERVLESRTEDREAGPADLEVRSSLDQVLWQGRKPQTNNFQANNIQEKRGNRSERSGLITFHQIKCLRTDSSTRDREGHGSLALWLKFPVTGALAPCRVFIVLPLL